MNSISSTASTVDARTLAQDRLRTRLAVGLFLILAALDLSLPRINFSVCYSLPLLLLVSRSTGTLHIKRYVLLMVVTVYASYYLKYRIVAGDPEFPLLTFRLFNRTFAAIALAMLGIAAQTWLYWQHERSVLSYVERQDEDAVNSTAGLIGCIGIGLVVAAIDLISPSNFNLCILFVVPLYLSSWMGRPRIVWITAASLIVMSVLGYLSSGFAYVPQTENLVPLNRLLVCSAILIMACILHLRITSQRNELAH